MSDNNNSINSIELQMISKILTSQSDEEIDALCSFDESYYGIFVEHIKFILEHRKTYHQVPDIFTFRAKFPNINLVQVNEPIEYLCSEIIKQKRRILLRDMFDKIKDLGSGDVDLCWEFIRHKCNDIEALDNTKPIDLVADAEERAEQVEKFSQQDRIPTGFPEIDKLMYGGLSTIEELAIIVARTGTGKAQPLWSKVLTPTGWKTMGEIQVGDLVVGKNNDNGHVIQIFPQGEKDYYRVHFSDGTFTECCGDHLWEVLDVVRRTSGTRNYGEHLVLTTDEISKSLNNHYSVDISEPIEFNIPFDEDSEPDPYLVGQIIGGMDVVCDTYGSMQVDNDNAFIPKKYLTAPVSVRRELLNGLLNTDCCVECDWLNTTYFTTSSEQLADDVAELTRSLGFFVKVNKDENLYCSKNSIKIEIRVYPIKYIDSIEYVGKTECQCILLDNESHTYITDNYTVTHNTWFCTRLMESAQKHGFPVLYYSPEMQASYLGTRFDTWRSHFNNTNLFLGRYDEAYKKYIEELRMQPTSAYVLEDKDVEGGIVTVDKVSDMVKKYKIKLLIIDGLSYMTDIRHATTDHERYRNICHDLFRLSKQYGCAVVIAMQANRETKDCKDEKGEPFPGIMQIEGSDHPARIATQVFAVRQIFDKHVLDIRLEKSRNANNQKPVLSYSWDVNTGNMQYLPNGDDSATTAPSSVAPSVSIQSVLSHNQTPANTDLDDDDFDGEEVEF